ncbi:MAG: hypothetical protein IPL88_17110 [Rhizobiales bacterium]|nr:hypothetical protein [Hyphomicrobiales bacterium]
MRGSFLLGLAVTAAAAGPARADCAISGFRWYLGQDVNARIEVRSGEPCLKSVGLNDGAASVSRLRIVRPASHGIAGVSGRSTYAYKSNPGYVGPDGFVVEIAGERAKGGGAAKTRITFDVTVTK